MKNKTAKFTIEFSLERWIDSKIGKLNSQEIFEQILKLCILLAGSASIGNIILKLGNTLVISTILITLIFVLLYYLCHFNREKTFNHNHINPIGLDQK